MNTTLTHPSLGALEVSFCYHAEERQTDDCPGNDEEYEVYQVMKNGLDIIEELSDDVLQWIEEELVVYYEERKLG